MASAENDFPIRVRREEWLPAESRLTAHQAQSLGFFLYDLIINHIAPDDLFRTQRDMGFYDSPLRQTVENLAIQYNLDDQPTILLWLNSASRQTALAVLPFLKIDLESEIEDERRGIGRGHTRFYEENIEAAQQVATLGIDAIIKDHKVTLDNATSFGYPTTLRFAVLRD